jgi:hypothetical protein
MFLRRRFVTKSFRAGRHSRRLAIVLYVVRHRTMASESHRFGVRFAPNRARWVTYRGPILSGGKTRKKGQGNEWVRRRIGTHRETRRRNRVRREELAGEADLPASGRAEEEPESTPHPRGRVLSRRREKSLSPAGRGRSSGPLPLPSRLLWFAELPPKVFCRAASSG